MFFINAFKGNNKFLTYLLGTILIIIITQIIGILPPLITLLVQAINNGNVDLNIISNISNATSSQNLNLLLMLFPFVLGFITYFIIIKYLHHKKIKDVITERPKFDIKRFIISFSVWGGLTLISLFFSVSSNNSSLVWNFQPQEFFVLLAIGLLILPMQTSFEEFLFRSYFMQGFAVTTKTRWAPLLVTSIVFGLLHSANPEVQEFGFLTAMPTYIIMGLVLGLTVVMDGGLEIALGLHYANNLFSSLLYTSDTSTLQTPALFLDTKPEMSPFESVGILIYSIIFILICKRIFKWKDWGKIFRKIEIDE